MIGILIMAIISGVVLYLLPSDFLLEVKFKKLNDKAVIPQYSRIGDGALDLTATSVEYVYKDGYWEYGVGLAVEIPKGYLGLLLPRSSVSNKELILSNSCGLIDSNFRGEIRMRYKLINDKDIQKNVYNVGDRIGQLLIIPYPQIIPIEVNELSNTNRNENGFGSSGT